MPTSAPSDASQQNRRAVQRLFAEKRQQQQQPLRPASHSGYISGGGAGGTSTSRPSTAINLATYYASQQQKEQLSGISEERTAGTPFASGGTYGYGYGRSRQPAWVQVGSRECLREPSLDVVSHLTHQLSLSAEIATGASGGAGGLSADEYRELVARATALGSRATSAGDPKRSCFALHVAKRQHLVEVGDRASSPSAAADGGYTRRELALSRERAYHHQQAILRNEQALARKRAAAVYTGLTAAQADAAFIFPNAHTLDRLVAERCQGRWALDNTHRQLLRRGEPLMTQVMRGDFYESFKGRDSTGAPVVASPQTGSPRRGGGQGPLHAASVNKRDVRVASAINAAVRRSRSCEGRSRGGCYCAVPSAAA